ncbi:RVT_3 domain-containing protein, partial [Cephalotus follicularis]
GSTRVKTCRLIGWSPPPKGFLKLNTNGSIFDNTGKASLGSIFRDHEAELWGLRDGLLLTLQMKFYKLHISIDAKIALSLIQSLNSANDHHYSLLI